MSNPMPASPPTNDPFPEPDPPTPPPEGRRFVQHVLMKGNRPLDPSLPAGGLLAESGTVTTCGPSRPPGTPGLSENISPRPTSDIPPYSTGRSLVQIRTKDYGEGEEVVASLIPGISALTPIADASKFQGIIGLSHPDDPEPATPHPPTPPPEIDTPPDGPCPDCDDKWARNVGIGHVVGLAGHDTEPASARPDVPAPPREPEIIPDVQYRLRKAGGVEAPRTELWMTSERVGVQATLSEKPPTSTSPKTTKPMSTVASTAKAIPTSSQTEATPAGVSATPNGPPPDNPPLVTTVEPGDGPTYRQGPSATPNGPPPNNPPPVTSIESGEKTKRLALSATEPAESRRYRSVTTIPVQANATPKGPPPDNPPPVTTIDPETPLTTVRPRPTATSDQASPVVMHGSPSTEGNRRPKNHSSEIDPQDLATASETIELESDVNIDEYPVLEEGMNICDWIPGYEGPKPYPDPTGKVPPMETGPGSWQALALAPAVGVAGAWMVGYIGGK